MTIPMPLALRTASVLTMIFAAGHAFGGLQSWSPPGNTAVLQTMRSFRFDADGASRTYWDFYVGFGVIITVYLLAQAVMLWQLSALSKTAPSQVRPIVAVILVSVVANAVLAWQFFFAIPVVLGLATAVSLGLALRRSV